MQILYRSGSTAYGREGDKHYILTGCTIREGKYTCDAQSEIPESLVELIGPIEGSVTAVQRRIIAVAADIYAPKVKREKHAHDRSELIERILSTVNSTPNPIKAALFWLNTANPFIKTLYEDYCHEHRIPTQYPMTDKQRIDFELSAIESMLNTAHLYYRPKSSGGSEKGQQKTD